MRVVGVIQARFSSRRLPGKILMKLRDRPSLYYVIEALRNAARLDRIVVSTSTDPSDAATDAFVAACGVPCYRGPLDDVATRLLRTGEEYGADAIVRISGDSPLMDPVLVDQAVGLFREGSRDLVSNVRPRSFPKGQSVEVISTTALRSAVAAMSTHEEREHVTPYLYAHPERYSLGKFVADEPRPGVQLSIDTGEDFRRCAAILEMLAGPPWKVGWRACVAAYDRYLTAASASRSA
jgi:spore coat polysaccharide biosynthesis protein SpsF